MKKFIFFLVISFISSSTVFSYGQQELAGYKFIENKGQWEDQVEYRADLRCGHLYLQNDGILFNLIDGEQMNRYVQSHYDKSLPKNTKPMRYHAYKVNFVGMNENYNISSSSKTPEYYNYFLSSDRSKWASKAHGYHRVRYENLYNGIDMQFYSKIFNLKYDFIVQPNADPSQIQLDYEGANSVAIKNNKLHVYTDVNHIIEDEPYAYQLVNGVKTKVACKYVLKENSVSFEFPDGYDTSLELIIDPTLIFSTYSGSISDNFGYSATFDSKGFLYSASSSFGTTYPTTLGAYDVTHNGGAGLGLGIDIAISKFDTSGTFLIYSTYVGGSSDELPHSLIVNTLDELFILGTTSSFDYPVSVGAYDTVFNGGPALSLMSGLGANYPNGVDIIATNLSSDGAILLASTFIGGTGNDGLNFTSVTCPLNVLKYNYADEVRGEIDIDANNNIYIVSCTMSTDFPIVGSPFQPTYGGGPIDGVVIKLDNSLQNVIWSSYFGGEKSDAGYSLALDSNEDLYITGGTDSDSLRTTNGVLDTAFLGGRSDGFIAHIAANGSQIFNASYIGSPTYDQSYFVEVDRYNNVYLLGQTEVQDSTFIHNAAYSDLGSGQFVSKLTPQLDSLIYSTVFGNGLGISISPTAFLVDLCNKIYLSGWGGSTNAFNTCNLAVTTTGMPTTFDAFQSTTDGSDHYIMVLEDDASNIVYGSFFGGPTAAEHVDGGTSRFDRKGKVYQAMCAGCGGNSDMPISPGAVSPTNNSTNCNLGVFKMDFNIPAVVADFDTPPLGCSPFTYTFNNTSLSQNFTTYQWDFGDGSGFSTVENPTYTYTGAGTFVITLIVSDTATCNFGDTISKDITILGDTTYSLVDIQICPGSVEQIGLSPSPDTTISYIWVTGLSTLTDTTASNPFATPTVTTTYTLLVTNGICTDTVFQTIVVDVPLLTVSNDTTLCDGITSVTLTANSFGTSTEYHWSSSIGFLDTLNPDLTSDSLVVSPTVPTMYYVMINNNGCTLYDSIYVDLASSQMLLSPTQFICEGDVITISVTNLNPSDTLLYDWSNDLDIISGDSTDVITVSPVMDTWFYVTSVNGSGCVLVDSVLITVSNLSTSAVNAWADFDTIPENVSVGLHVTPGGYTYTWTPPGTLDNPTSQNPIASPDATTTYYVVITDGACTKSDTVTVTVAELICGQPDVYVPNAFTPDANGNNDFVRVRGNNIKELVFRIYNRWGELVFETKDQSQGWDGTFKGRAGDPAVYVYYLDIICIDDETYFEKGNITLIR
jgi:gliding motility-associated-like protein